MVKAGAEHRVKQGADYQPGVSAETVGSQVIWLGLMTLPPGARTKAHVHEHHETALYMMSGDVLELWTGDDLEHCDSVRPGDYIYIPANVLHVAVNRGADARCLHGLAQRSDGAGEPRPAPGDGCAGTIVLQATCDPLQSKSAVGLGCVKTQLRGEPIEWTFLGFAICVVRNLKHGRF